MILDASASSSSVLHSSLFSSSMIGLLIETLFEIGILICFIGVFQVSSDEGV